MRLHYYYQLGMDSLQIVMRYSFLLSGATHNSYFFIPEFLFVAFQGGNTGIGKATALDLAKRGARVILACRNKQRAEAAVFDIRKVIEQNVI